jgi:shikimate kinase
MKGRARARCAVSVVNGTATGKGASLAVDLFVDATVELDEDSKSIEVEILPEKEESPRLAEEVVRRVLDRLGHAEFGARVKTRSDAPASMGLKTSSAAANAIAAATNAACQRYDGEGVSAKELLPISIDAALSAKVTITGAFDDACASARGGLCVADNRARQLLARHEIPTRAAVVWLPGGKVRKEDAARFDLRMVVPAASIAHDLALKGAWRDAMLVNALGFGSVYGSDFELQRRLLAAGADAVSVSGTGPAIAALCAPDRKSDVVRALAQSGGRVLETATSNAPMEVLP